MKKKENDEKVSVSLCFDTNNFRSDKKFLFKWAKIIFFGVTNILIIIDETIFGLR